MIPGTYDDDWTCAIRLCSVGVIIHIRGIELLLAVIWPHFGNARTIHTLACHELMRRKTDTTRRDKDGTYQPCEYA